jgi:hypothetical protein
MVAAAVLRANDDLVPLDKGLLAEGTAFFKKGGVAADTEGADHIHQRDTAI